MAVTDLPPPSELHKYLSYNPETGELLWKARTPEMFEDGVARTAQAKCEAFNSKLAGKEFGTNSNGYRRGTLWGRQLQGHRIAWALHYGDWPAGEIDHINGKPSDNRIINLRDVTLSVNQRNRVLSSRNTSGVCGVVPTTSGKWHAYIVVQRKRIDLGTHSKKFDAVLLRLQAEKQHGFSIRHGLAA